MSPREVRDRAASVRQRLLDRARAAGEDFNLTLTRYTGARLPVSRPEREPHLVWVLGAEIVVTERGEQADDAAWDAQRGGSEVVELGHVGVGEPVEPAADAFDCALGFEPLKRGSRDAELGEIARAHEPLTAQERHRSVALSPGAGRRHGCETSMNIG